MKTITPFLWFDDNLEEAVEFYSSIFPDAKAHGMSRSPEGKVFGADFELAGQQLKGLNGGPHFTEQIGRVMTAMQTMQKMDVAAFRAAYDA